jgi:energy-coupling factor transporter transmembrane protein EcfT
VDITALLIVAYFVVLLLTLRWSSRVIQGPWLFFLRAFFPNWKFFHAVGHVPHLYVRGQSLDGDWTNWFLVYPQLPRRWHHLFHNPAVNLALSHQNLVDHFASDLNALPDGADASVLPTYRLVTRLAHQAIGGDTWGHCPMLGVALPPMGYFQFQLRMELPASTRSELMLQSPVMAVWG